MELQELISNIEQWAEDRNLIEGSTPQKQMLKLMEEFGELCSGVSKNKPEMIKDSIGDCFVVLVILNHQLEGVINIPILLSDVCAGLRKAEMTDDKDVTLLLTTTYLGRLSRAVAVIEVEEVIESLAFVISALFVLSSKLYLDFQDCIKHAYDQIKNRKGKMINGVFVKEEDL